MGGKNGKQQANDKPSGWVGIVTGKTGKIVAALTVLGTLGTQIEHIVGRVKEIPKMVKSLIPGSGSETDCLTGELHVTPVAARYKEWRAVQFQLTGQNRCPQSLQVHVTYKTQNETLRIEPTMDKSSDQLACSGYDKSDCWETKSLDARQAVDWKLIPPKLIKLGELKNPVTIAINWMVFDSKAGQQVRSGTQAVTVRDDQ